MFLPIWTVPQGIKEVWSDAGERGLTTEDFEGPRYVRLKRIQRSPMNVDWTYRTCGSAELRVIFS